MKGFTLVEVLLTLIILAVLTTLTAQTIQRSTSIKSKLQKGIDQQSAVRNAVTVMERDISLAFNYRDPNAEVQAAIKKRKQEQAAATGVPPEDDGQPVAPPPPILTHFIGDSDKIAFTALSGVRTFPNSPISEQQEVSYEVKSCKSFFNPSQEGSCLFRRSAPNIDDDLTSGGDEIAILEGVTDFKLRYFGEGKEDWVETWKTKDGADDVTRGRFPLAVEITVEQEENGKKFKMTTVAELRFPNNKPREEPNAQNPSQ